MRVDVYVNSYEPIHGGKYISGRSGGRHVPKVLGKCPIDSLSLGERNTKQPLW